MSNYIGVKAALLLGNELVIIQRDNKPGLPYAGLWDFPGGGSEGDETPFECIAREINEELNLDIKKSDVVWEKVYPAVTDPQQKAYFMVINIDKTTLRSIKLGDEGQAWKLVGVDDFMQATDVVEHLKGRLQDYLSRNSAKDVQHQ